MYEEGSWDEVSRPGLDRVERYPVVERRGGEGLTRGVAEVVGTAILLPAFESQTWSRNKHSKNASQYLFVFWGFEEIITNFLIVFFFSY